MLTVTDLVEDLKSERICCKISVSKKLGRGTLSIARSSETIMSQTQEIKTFPAKNECNSVNCGVVRKIQFQILNCQIYPGLNQPVNRVASTTAGFKLQ